MLANLFYTKNERKDPATGLYSFLKVSINTHMRHTRLLYLLMLLVISVSSSFAQTLDIGPKVGGVTRICSGDQPLFTLSNSSTKTPAYYRFDLTPGYPLVVNSPTSSYSPVGLPPGSYTLKAFVQYTDSTSSSVITQTFDKYYPPVADFEITTQDTQCFGGNLFCVKNKSVQNTSNPSNPLLNSFYWNWGDGRFDSTHLITDTICHHYVLQKGFEILLRVTDSKGCFSDWRDSAWVLPDIGPEFTVNKFNPKWSPCFRSLYKFTNTTPININLVKSFTWNSGGGSFIIPALVNPNQNPPLVNLGDIYSATVPSTGWTQAQKDTFDNIIVQYTKNGYYYPSLTITNIYGCTQTYKITPSSALVPYVIVLDFDVVTTKSPTDTILADSVCSPNGQTICLYLKETPPPMDQQYLNWDFGDYSPPCVQTNFVSGSWRACHSYTCGLGSYFPVLTVKGLCPDRDLVYNYYSKITLENNAYIDTFDNRKYINQLIIGSDDNQDPRARPRIIPDTLPTATQIFDNPFRRECDSIPCVFDTFYVSGTDTVFRYRPLYRWIWPDTLSITSYPDSLFNPDTTELYTWDTASPPNKIIKDTILYYYKSSVKWGYGVRILGPAAGIEKPPPFVLKPQQKNQCGPEDTVDFLQAASSYFKSRKVWRLWDFDDTWAPRCTSFSVAKPGWPKIISLNETDSVTYDDSVTWVHYGVAPTGPPVAPWPVVAWRNAAEQFHNSEHYFIQNGRIYPGRRQCKFSMDTLPRHSYPHYDTAYLWYRYGHDFMPWDLTRWSLTPGPGQFKVQPWDLKYWGNPVYLNVESGEWSLTPGTSFYQKNDFLVPGTPFAPGQGYVVDWPRIDTIADLQLTDRVPNSPLQINNLPDPYQLAAGNYYLLSGGTIDTTTGCPPKAPITYQPNPNTTVTIPCATEPIPGCSKLPGRNCWDFYEYVWRRSFQLQCKTVTLKLADTANNESVDPAEPMNSYAFPGTVIWPKYDPTTQTFPRVPVPRIDSFLLDANDCSSESTVQLRLGKPDAHGLGKAGLECPGSFRDANAGVRFLFNAANGYPGLAPSCGRSYIIFNLDSTADRQDATPCILDGFTTWEGGTTLGGLSYPVFNTCWDCNGQPGCPWTSAGGVENRYHWGANAICPSPMPADQDGWVTVGLAIGNGCRDSIRYDSVPGLTIKGVLQSKYLLNQDNFGNPIKKAMFNDTTFLTTLNGNFIPLTVKKVIGHQTTNYGDTIKVLIPNFNSITPVPQPIGWRPDSTAVNYLFSGIRKKTPVVLPGNIKDTVLELEYIDCNYPRCISDTIWYHNFLRIIGVIPTFEVHPVYFNGVGVPQNTSSPVSRYVRTSYLNDILQLYHKGETITVHYIDSLQDSIKYSNWQWTDGTVTVDSFWYAGYNVTDAFYTNGIRRVRYNWDVLDPNNRYVIDSLVWPYGPPGVRTDKIQTRSYQVIFTPQGFKPGPGGPQDSIVIARNCPSNSGAVPYPYFRSIDTFTIKTADTALYCTYATIDTAMMFLPVSHTFIRTSWDASWPPPILKRPGATTGLLQHNLVSTKGCNDVDRKRITVGWIDSLRIYDIGKDGNVNKEDTLFCVGEFMEFRDSVRYWRFDNQLTSLPFVPAVSRTGSIGYTNFGYTYGTAPYNSWQFDSINFWANRVTDKRTITHIENGKPRSSTWFSPITLLPTVTFPGNDGLFIESIWWTPKNIIFFNPTLSRLDTTHFDTIYRVDTFYTERIYWDFGDGSPIDSTHNPRHKYASPGRYKVTMATRDSCGWFDTCIAHVVIVKPVAKPHTVQTPVGCNVGGKFIDTSTILGPSGMDSILHNYWWFGEVKDDTITVQGKDFLYPQMAQWPYKKNGWDTIKMVIETYQGCFDTGYTTIFIQGPDPFFEILSDTLGCKPFKVKLHNLADLFRPNPLDTFTKETLIDWGDGFQDYLSGISDTIEHTYKDSGTYRIVASGFDVPHLQGANICPVTFYPDTSLGEKEILIYVRQPSKVDIFTTRDTVCVDEVFSLYNYSDSTQYASYTVERFENDTVLLDSILLSDAPPSSDQFTTKFTKEGHYRLIMRSTSYQSTVPLQAQCPPVRDTADVVALRPTADFAVDTLQYPTFHFYNWSSGADQYDWSIMYADGRPYDKQPLPVRKVNNLDRDWTVELGDDTGTFKVCLWAYRTIPGQPTESCPDSICKPVNNTYITKIIIPNVFTPNGDGSNDFFKIDIEGELKYDLVIFNRWGNKVFESDNKDNQWNGKNYNTGSEDPSGVYFFIFSYRLRGTNEDKTVNGTVTLIRKE